MSAFAVPPRAKKTTVKAPKKVGVVSKLKNAAIGGFGWGLGREAAKETVKGVKKVYQKVKGSESEPTPSKK
jgi:hypothetical protein